MPQPNALRLVVWITFSSSRWARYSLIPGSSSYSVANFVNTELHGVLAGGLNGGILSSFEILVLRGAYGAPLRKLPFLPYLALRSLKRSTAVANKCCAANNREERHAQRH
jgi:hypothetical protein